MICEKIEKPKLSSNFTIDDIHKIREYNYECTKNMNREELMEYYEKKASEAMKELGLT